MGLGLADCDTTQYSIEQKEFTKALSYLGNSVCLPNCHYVDVVQAHNADRHARQPALRDGASVVKHRVHIPCLVGTLYTWIINWIGKACLWLL